MEEVIKNYFIASRSPLYIGVILPPSEGLWTFLKSESMIVIRTDGFSSEFLVPYRIEVGENTIFFLKPESGDADILKTLEESKE